MIYSPGRNYLFVHIPKTGGTALATTLEERAMRDDVLIGDTPKAQRRRQRVKKLPAKGRLWKHSTLRDIDGWLSPDDLQALFVFTLVRNPWDRLVSYYHWLRDQRFDHVAVTLAHTRDFAGFINHPHTQSSLRAASYASYVTDISGALRCDAFVRLEHLQDDLAPLEKHLGFAVAPERMNASNRRADYRGYYTPQLIETVADVCADDIEKFNYAFE